MYAYVLSGGLGGGWAPLGYATVMSSIAVHMFIHSA